MQIGDVYKWDYQSDIFQGEYRIVENLGGGRWIIEDVEPSDELIDEVIHYYQQPGAYLGWHDPFGPERRKATVQEAIDEEILTRIDRTGTRREVKFISAAQYASMF